MKLRGKGISQDAETKRMASGQRNWVERRRAFCKALRFDEPGRVSFFPISPAALAKRRKSSTDCGSATLIPRPVISLTLTGMRLRRKVLFTKTNRTVVLMAAISVDVPLKVQVNTSDDSLRRLDANPFPQTTVSYRTTPALVLQILNCSRFRDASAHTITGAEPDTPSGETGTETNHPEYVVLQNLVKRKEFLSAVPGGPACECAVARAPTEAANPAVQPAPQCRELTPQTVQRIYTTLCVAPGRAEKWGLVVRNVAALVEARNSRRLESTH